MNERSTAAVYPLPPPLPVDVRPDGHRIGMLVFFLSEASFFSTLLVAYLIYMGHSSTGPTPAEVLSLPLAFCTTFCLLSSSFTVHLAERALRAGQAAAFQAWWIVTMVLGTAFLVGTGYEWYELIWHHQLTISRNLFGTTFFTLVGFHAAHVTVGLLLLALMLGLYRSGRLDRRHSLGVEMVSWYWHFVDGVWVAVFTVVYLIGALTPLAA